MKRILMSFVCIKFNYESPEVPNNRESKWVNKVAFQKASTFQDGYDQKTLTYADDCEIKPTK